MMRSARIAGALFVLLQLAVSHTFAAGGGETFRLVFPAMQLDSKLNQAMEEITLSVACGHIDAVMKIPDLWSIEIQRAVSGLEEFRASAGLGAARLINPMHWSNSIVITQTDPSCFAVSGSIVIGGEKYLQFPLSNSNLRRAAKTK